LRHEVIIDARTNIKALSKLIYFNV